MRLPETPAVLTAAEMRAAEADAVARGISLLQLMENAGQGAARDLLHRFPHRQNIVLLCGKGNNGGDALVMARVLADAGWKAAVCFVQGVKLSDLAQTNRERLPENVTVVSVQAAAAQTADIVVDAVFGTGFSGSLNAETAEIMRLFNRKDVFRVALDIPSGAVCDSGAADKDTFQAALTYAFGAFKPVHFHENSAPFCGEVVWIKID